MQNIPEQSLLFKAKEIKGKRRIAEAVAVSREAITCCQHHNIYSARENLHSETRYSDGVERELERSRRVRNGAECGRRAPY